MAQMTPLVYDASSGQHRPAVSGEQIGISYVPVDSGSMNLLRANVNTGLGLFGTDLISLTTSGNMLKTDSQGKLYVEKEKTPEIKLLSTQNGNYLRLGSDTGLFLDGNDVLSNADDNLLRIDRVDGKIKLTSSLIKEELKLGDTTISSVTYDQTTGTLTFVSGTGSTVAQVYIPTGGTVLEGAELVVDPDGQPAGTYIRMSFAAAGGKTDMLYINVSDLVDIYTAGKGVTVESNQISAKLRSTGGIAFDSNNALYVNANDLRSSTSGNMLTVDSSGKLSVTASSLVGTAGSGLKVNSNGTISVDPAALVSADSGNLLKTGTDGKLKAELGNVASSLISPTNSKGLKANSDGTLRVDPNDLVSTASTNLLIVDSTGGLYVDAKDILSSIISPSAGSGLAVDSDGRLRVDKTALVKSGDKVLAGTYDGITSTLGLTYDQTTGKLTLTGISGQTVATATIPSATSTLESTQVVTNPAGQPAGVYLAMTFKRSDGTTDIAYVDMSAVNNVYSAGNGINITNRVISAKLSANSGLVSTSTGLAIDKSVAAAQLRSTDAGNAIAIGSDGLLYVTTDYGVL